MSYSARRSRTRRCSSSPVVVHSNSSAEKSGKDASGSRTDPSNSLMTLSLETSAAPQSGHRPSISLVQDAAQEKQRLRAVGSDMSMLTQATTPPFFFFRWDLPG